MEVQLTQDQKAFIRLAIAAGRMRREEEAVEQALAIWEERERVRLEILEGVDRAERSLARGQGFVITENSLQTLAERVKRRGRATFASGTVASMVQPRGKG